MFEVHSSTTYEEAFARARAERARVFRSLFSFRRPGWALMSGARTA
ncbi:hypothetical protein [Jannaschia seohaensis]|uniref:Uncharacterized protein n=1 Tax=Jannaschia seohaensis TaxID=475081 RepID=A0A2Y9AQL9_9RHOB|nr:hypothetical protein [Jannaschia seohaensis]PWJ18159.1 hypothetical protein BCF38_105147 [Jannaschia seohaensis]SSA46684.1 hypothetical protein SAMN05421539_105147 [Jannaschia seohaensis]